jgi:type II secretory pathway component PulM
MSKMNRYPARGERIAPWVEAYMRANGLSVGELAFKVKADKRDLQRLIKDRSCGPRLNDALEEALGWEFIEEVATPVVGADPITAREREVEQRLAQAAALHARVERERAVRTAASPGLALVERGQALQGA